MMAWPRGGALGALIWQVSWPLRPPNIADYQRILSEP